VNKWGEVLRDPDIHFPGESGEYRRARNQLLEAEDELRRLSEQVAAQRRALPAGGLLEEDYVFESAADGGEVRFSELFAPGKDTLVIYSMMFPRWSQDPRAGVPAGETALLPLAEQPCPSCTSRDSGGIHHRWGSELTFARGDSSQLDPIWPIWGALDLTPDGRGDTAAYPSGSTSRSPRFHYST
jgi:predicted dithiol-disulfide oxidoreductase (DUF899 family)